MLWLLHLLALRMSLLPLGPDAQGSTLFGMWGVPRSEALQLLIAVPLLSLVVLTAAAAALSPGRRVLTTGVFLVGAVVITVVHFVSVS